VPLVQKQFWTPSEGEADDDDGRFHQHVQRTQHFVEERRFSDALDVQDSKESD